eukprot:9492092-Pyramimonas_sp.AAC.2
MVYTIEFQPPLPTLQTVYKRYGTSWLFGFKRASTLRLRCRTNLITTRYLINQHGCVVRWVFCTADCTRDAWYYLSCRHILCFASLLIF